MRLLLIRHADPDYANDALTDKGHEQARALAESLAESPIDAIYVSPLGRAQLTAGYAATRRDQETETLEWLRELNGKYAEGKWSWNMHGATALDRDDAFTFREWPDQIEYGPHMSAVAEPFYERFDAWILGRGYERDGLRYRVAGGDGKTVAFFCHAGVILTLLAHLLHVPLPIAYAQFGCDPSSVTTLRMEEMDGYGVFRLVGLNDTSHVTA